MTTKISDATLVDVYNDGIYRVAKDQEGRFLLAEWLREPVGAEYRASLLQLIEAVRSTGINKVLSIIEGMGAVAPEEQEWTITEWVPQALAAGYKYSAMVVGGEIFAQVSLDSMMEHEANAALQEDSPMVSQMFGSVADAMAWIIKL